jgi:methylation protein EvaC
MDYNQIMNDYSCRVSNSPLKKIMDFGKQPLGNGFLDPDNFSTEYFYDMSIGFSQESLMVQLLNQPSPQKMFHNEYAFYSSTSDHMKKHFEEFANYVLSSSYMKKDSPFVMELGCNDGILLKHFAARNIRSIGIEPSENVAREANRNGVQTISDFFSENLADKILSTHGKVDVFLAANVMCHISNILSVVKGIKKLLTPRGVVIFEDPYLGDILEKISYDQIYDEHVFLFSLLSVRKLFSKVDMELIDILPQKTHGGSMRYVLSHTGSYPISNTVHKKLDEEKVLGLDNFSTFINFKDRVHNSKIELLKLLQNLKSQGKLIAGYAATSKSTTILNYCGIGPNLISYIYDSTPIKQGKFTPGMHIPVVSRDVFVNNPPDFSLLFAWNHAEEIMLREKAYTDLGGRWITHVPQVRLM